MSLRDKPLQALKMYYVTKWALTGPVLLVRGEVDEDGYLHFVNPGASNNESMVGPQHVHVTSEAAQACVKQLAKKQLKSLAQQVARMEKRATEGTSVETR